MVLVVAGNKTDLERQRVVSRQVAEKYAESVGARYVETSAKIGRGVVDTFQLLTEQLLDRGQLHARSVSSVGRSQLSISDEVEPLARSKCC